MSRERIEAMVAAFLDARDAEPSLTPDAFVTRLDSEHSLPAELSSPNLRAELLASLQSVLEIDRLLPGMTAPPLEIGPYHVVRELGRGGMGIVYEVERGGERAALKLHPLSPLLATQSSARLRREIEALASISHPNIVRIVDSGEEGGSPYIVMELVDGVRLDEAGLSRDRAVEVTRALAEAVSAAHARGVIHRDLKPQNVILRRSGEPVLVDFGLSLSEELPSLTVTGELLGTPRYMAPEQVADGAADARTDVYALGLILYELIVGRPARGSSSRQGLLREVSEGSLLRPRHVDSTIAKPLERILLQALAFSPEDRYQTAAELGDDLARFERGEPVHARPPRAVTSQGERNRRVQLLAALAVVVALTTLFAVSRKQDAASTERRAQSTTHLHRALEAYFDGDTLAARTEVRLASASDRANVTAASLAAHLRLGGSRVPRGPVGDLFRAYQRSDTGAVRGGLSGARDLDPGLHAALKGWIAARGGKLEVAEKELGQASELLPGSSQLVERLAQVYRRQGFLPRAHELLTRATTIDSTDARLWLARATLEFQRRDMEGGLRSIERAKRFGDSTATEVRLLEASICANFDRTARARELLQHVLAEEPDRPEAWFQLGYSYDMDHMLVPAVAAYERTCLLKPSDPLPRSCLANLFSGASRGHCQGCDSAFAAHPEMYDLTKAERNLLQCLRLDNGRQEWVAKSMLDVALRLERRERVIALIDSLTTTDRTSASALRLLDLGRRLRLTSGRG